MAGNLLEILIGREHGQIMPDANLRKQSINRPHLYPTTAAVVS